jgi:hypothetical protein
MLTEILRQYSAIVSSWRVTSFDREGHDFRLKAQVVFVDGSTLHIRQVVFDRAMLKYAYHWQDADGALLARWDNAEHWPDIPTFPHHQHVFREGLVVVIPSTGGDLASVLEEIAAAIARTSESNT